MFIAALCVVSTKGYESVFTKSLKKEKKKETQDNWYIAFAEILILLFRGTELDKSLIS